MQEGPQKPDSAAGGVAGLLDGHQAMITSLLAETRASRWGLTSKCFQSALERSVKKRFLSGSPSQQEVQNYLNSLHIEDLALACACAEGHAAAWEEFVATYRGYLRAAAATILHTSSAAPEAIEFADSLFAELYGLADGKRGERSLFRYFHGRSTLKTWLRAVLAQRRIDVVRAAKKFESLDDGPDGESKIVESKLKSEQPLSDPHRGQYLEAFRGALQAALETLDARDLERLRMYYAQEFTLAEIGRKLGEHESSVSRNLERIRKTLRSHVEESLRQGIFSLDGSGLRRGFSEEQISLCFEYAAAEAPIDLEKMLGERGAPGTSTERRRP